MKCHYVYDKEVGRVLIPGCWSVVMSNDIKIALALLSQYPLLALIANGTMKRYRKRNAIIKDLRRQVEYLQNELDNTIKLLTTKKNKL